MNWEPKKKKKSNFPEVVWTFCCKKASRILTFVKRNENCPFILWSFHCRKITSRDQNYVNIEENETKSPFAVKQETSRNSGSLLWLSYLVLWLETRDWNWDCAEQKWRDLSLLDIVMTWLDLTNFSRFQTDFQSLRWELVVVETIT